MSIANSFHCYCEILGLADPFKYAPNIYDNLNIEAQEHVCIFMKPMQSMEDYMSCWDQMNDQIFLLMLSLTHVAWDNSTATDFFQGILLQSLKTLTLQ